MLHYLFTNDLRHDAWPDILVDASRLIRDDKVPSAYEDKSKNNYIRTQESYLCLHRGTRANALCSDGKCEPVILNFINRFQFPNARTKDSFSLSVSDGMSVAPLRLAVQILFVLNMIDRRQAHLSYDELARFVICNENVAKGKNVDIVTIATSVVAARKTFDLPPKPSSEYFATVGVEWKHCPRQVREMFSLLEYAPFITATQDEVKLIEASGISVGR